MRPSVVRTLALACVAPVCVALLAGCAQQPGGGSDAGGPASPSGTEGTATDAPASATDGPVLEIAYVGGFVMPAHLLGRLPLAAVYADGRAITEGPVIAIHPGPALPNVQVAELAPETVQDLVDRAVAAGVGEEFDHGMPPVADAPSTRITVVTEEGTRVTEVYALSEALSPGPTGDEPLPGLTEEQVAARAELLDLVDAVTGAASSATQPYVPEAVAAVASPWVDPGDGLPAPEPVAWPGPPLPGEPVGGGLDLHCVTARAEAADAVLEAAASANQLTPWTAADGSRWSLLLRPLLPHERGCADLGDRPRDGG